MEHPPKQGLKRVRSIYGCCGKYHVLMEHPPKQGLKQLGNNRPHWMCNSFNGTSTKTRIET